VDDFDSLDLRDFDIRQKKSVIQKHSTFQMKTVISKYVLVVSMLMITFSLSAQKNVRKNIRQGNKAFQEQKYTEASKFYQDAIEENPKSTEANFNLGNAFYRQKQWDKSIEQMNHYLSIEKDDPAKMSAAWHNIGNALLQKKEIEKSIEAYKNALRLNPNDEETRYNLAVAQKIMQDQQQSENQNNQDKNQQQQQNEQQQQPQDQQNKNQKPEQPNEPEQMSQSNARQILQAIEQDEKETQQKVQQIKAQERQQKAEENRRQNKDW
jgi:tetratricopeptide (TPR) repeat protein